MSDPAGSPMVRADAHSKVTGLAQYAADVRYHGMAYAALVTSSIARGSVTRIDTGFAEAIPGVRLILTHLSVDDALARDGFLGSGGHFQSSSNPLGSDEVKYFGQILALVVADTAEDAEAAAGRVSIAYDTEPACAALADRLEWAERSTTLSVSVGDVSLALASSSARVDAQYETAAQHHNPLELYATTAEWSGDSLEVQVPTQWIAGTQAGLAQVLGLRRSKVRVCSRFVGGGFGGKTAVLWHSVLVAIAARRLGRPVQLVVSRTQMFTVGSFRPESLHRVLLGADTDARLTAYEHRSWLQTSQIDRNQQHGTHYTSRLYACPNILTSEYFVPTDTNTPGYMRAPKQYSCAFAQESALDELAVAVGTDPVELRMRNDTMHDPVSGLPFSSRSLAHCYARGAELFGWAGRNCKIGSMRDPDGSLLGWGCATAWYPVYHTASSARVRLHADGRVEVLVGTSDPGTGAHTVLKQIAADCLDVHAEMVTVMLGDSELPVGPMAAGSATTASAGSAVQLACQAVRTKLLAAAAVRGLLATRVAAKAVLRRGDLLRSIGLSAALQEIVSSEPGGIIEGEGVWAPPEFGDDQIRAAMGGQFQSAGPIGKDHAMFSFGAQFAEISIHPLTLQTRLLRLVGVFACGRILNPRLARSNLVGGMIWGASHALLEETAIDRARARFATTDLGSYHVACHADVPHVVVEMLDEADSVVNPLGVKGVGEIGVVGVAPAIANAIHHATGIRVRKTPILIDHLLAAWRDRGGPD